MTAPAHERSFPIDQVLVGWFVLLAIVVLLDFAAFPRPVLLLALVASALLASLALPRLLARASYRRGLLVRAAACIALVPFSFEIVGSMVPHTSPESREAWLLAADRWLLGSDPTRWTGDREALPWLTELFQLVYSSFYFLPVLFAGRALLRRDFRAIEHATHVIVLGFFLSYLGYFLVPARSPYHLAAYPFEFQGLALTPWLRTAIDTLEGVKYDCFPSGHSQLTFLVAALAARHDRRAFVLFFGPVALLLPIATIYLRYHYAVDVLAAVGFAWLTWRLVTVLERRGHAAPAPE